ncbi:asparaginase [Camelliibacillus cellulosilyticus]|uniref:Asparaginase n=1 Tax=Camelliibacillus cellulosilyticus TaxID=2174486 RepID=A0ABV9GNR5_9BACL
MIRVYRGNIIESEHHYHAAVVDNKGNLIYSYGDPDRQIFARSSMKPFQAIPLVETGAADHFHYSDRELSISCASHSGEPIHRETVLKILGRIGLSENALQCGTHIPRDAESYKELIRTGKSLTPVFSNCSGKHSGMLATAVYMSEDQDTYREISHPVQQRILQSISDVFEMTRDDMPLGTDGCGVPAHTTPLNKLALAFARLATPINGQAPHAEALKRISQAMMAHPEMVAGKDRFDTDVMALAHGKIVAKAGAEGVQCVGLVDHGIGIAVKIEDGQHRGTSAVVLDILQKLRIDLPGFQDSEAYQDYLYPIITNTHGDIVGKIIVG